MVHPSVYEALSKPIVGHLDPYFIQVMGDVQQLLKSAYGTSDGATLWHQALGEIGNARIGNGPISYELDGRQYLVVGGGSSLYAFALPAGNLSE